MIPQHTIQDIRERAADDIVDIIGEYVQLKRSGSSWKTECPFHEENTASFSISPERGIYKCFGCGEGGDAVDFIIKHTGKAFIDVIKGLARRFMIDIPDGNSTKKQSYGRSNIEICEAILPGLLDMKNRMRRNEKVFLLFDDACREKIADTAPWLCVDLPVSRGQYQIISNYASDVVLMGADYDINALLHSVDNGVKTYTRNKDIRSGNRRLESISIWAGENGYDQNWLDYLMMYHPEKTEEIGSIIIHIQNGLTYKIYQQFYIKKLKPTTKEN